MKPIRFSAVILTAIIIIAQYACISTSGTKQAEKLIEEKDVRFGR